MVNSYKFECNFCLIFMAFYDIVFDTSVENY